MKKSKWLPDEMENSFKEFYFKYGRAPKVREGGKKLQLPPPRSVSKEFGSWNNLIRKLDLPLGKTFEDSTVSLPCRHCGRIVTRLKCKIKPSGIVYCGYSCIAKWNNSHKTKNICRSKLEIFIESRIREEFADLEVLFNNRSAISSELDIYFPSLKLAFELNGIFHYEPIFGDKSFNGIINNDKRKFQACIEKCIELCVIDTSGQRKKSQMEGYYQIVKSVLGCRIARDAIVQ